MHDEDLPLYLSLMDRDDEGAAQEHDKHDPLADVPITDADLGIPDNAS